MKTLRDFKTHQDELEMKIEELRNSREELEASRNKLALLYDFAPVGYFTLDRHGAVKTVNLTGMRMLGRESTELVSREFREFVAEEERFVFKTFFHGIFNGNGKETCRLRLLMSNHQPLYVRIEAMATESGEECLVVLVDITERRRGEQALLESEYNLTKAQAMTHVGSWSYDPATGEVKASDELLKIMRLTRKEVTPDAFAGVIHPEDHDTVMEHLRVGREEGRSYEIEHRLRFDDGGTRWVYTIVEASVNSSGKVLKLYGTTQDITLRKKGEVELRNKTNELQAIFDSISDGIVVYDHDGLVQHHNLITPQLFPRKLLPGKSCRELFHPDIPRHRECPVELAIHGRRVERSLVAEGEGGKSQYVDVTATPISGELGENNRALLFFRDISEKRLQEMRLIQTEKMSSIGVLATGIAHEINNPLTSVAGYAEALQRRFRDQPELKEDPRLDVFPHYLEVIIRESYRCKGIIDHLLNFGRKSDGMNVKVEINESLGEILELIRNQPGYKRIKVVTGLQRDLPPVLGDPSGLRQLCMNLLINAHQAIKGAGTVEVTTAYTAGGMVTITIRDTGCGMKQGIMDRIWEPFFTTKEVGKGVGLGLALTYNIIKRHGGDIRVESRVNEGSLFTVTLPASGEGGVRF